MRNEPNCEAWIRRRASLPREPRPVRNDTQIPSNEMTYDSFLGRWVWTGYALANKDLEPSPFGPAPVMAGALAA